MTEGLGLMVAIFEVFLKEKANPSDKPAVCHLPFQGRLLSWEGSHEREAVTK